MCKAVEDYGLENFEEGKEEGKEAVAIEMLKDHLAYEKVMQYSGLSLERVQELAKKLDL